MRTDEPHPPLPTAEQVAKSRVRLEGRALTRFVSKLQGRYNLTAGNCVGLAPRFDVERLPGESQNDHAERLEWATHQCQACPALAKCGIHIPKGALGIIAGERYEPKQYPHTTGSKVT